MRWDGMDGWMGEKHDRHALIKAHTRARPESRWRADRSAAATGLRAEQASQARHKTGPRDKQLSTS